MTNQQKANQLLKELNDQNFKLHKNYEELFWIAYMGNHSVDKKKVAAQEKRDAFRANTKYPEQIRELLPHTSSAIQARLNHWLKFFQAFQTPQHALGIQNKITALESRILKKRSQRKEGYIDPYTKKFVVASRLRMSSMLGTNPDEKMRKAAFDAQQKEAVEFLPEYVQLIGLRNDYARALGYTDFYDFKLQREDGMTKQELFPIFDAIYEKTKYAFADIRKLEKTMPGLRKPWNFSYMMAGDFTKEQDPYFQFENALSYWGKSFAGIGVDYRGSTLQLDLCDRKGKWNNGFCQWPELVHYENAKRIPGTSNFTCNVVMGQPGQGSQGLDTLFHEGGHAAHLLNVEQQDNCLNSEYSPASSAWAETQSMFLDTMCGSIEWCTRYAKNKTGEAFPFELFQRIVEKLHPLRPLGLQGILFVSNFERAIYETKNLTEAKVLLLARKMHKKYTDRSVSALWALTVPHIYAWESSASYHNYGLAELALTQWREYFYQKYGYIVDNKNVGKEMARVWKLGSSKTFSECVQIATGKKVSADAWLKDSTMTVKEIIIRAKKRIARLQKVKSFTGPVRLNAKIRMVDGKKTIADNSKSFELMAEKYAKWLRTQV